MNTLKAILMIMLTTLSLQVWGVDCSSSNITLSTQEDVDNFQATYGVCDRVLGSLTVVGADITDIDGLANLTSVGGDLQIHYNAVLTDINGLANLTSVGGLLHIEYNAALTNIDGLTNLTNVGWLYIEYNAVLTDINGLANLTSAGVTKNV